MSVTTKERLLEFMTFKGITRAQFYNDLSIKRGLLDSDKLKATVPDTILAKILVEYADINIEWLLTGKGSMIRDIKTSEKRILDTTLNTHPISKSEESIIYEMFKDEKTEKERMLKEKDTKIDQLQSEIRSLEKELISVQTKLSHYEPETDEPRTPSKGLGTAKNASTKKPSSPNADNVTSATAQ